MDIARCTIADLDEWARMRAALWPDEAGLHKDAEAMLDLPQPDAVNLICRIGGVAAGFAEAALRRDYVNGCATSPVAFLEGIYVAPPYRRSGVARAFVARITDWARAQGCSEFASDALLDNHASHVFHRAIGFAETERVVYFRMQL